MSKFSFACLIFYLVFCGVASQDADQLLTTVKGELNFKGEEPNILPPGSCIWYRIYESREAEDDEDNDNDNDNDDNDNDDENEKREFVIAHKVEYVGGKFVRSGHAYSLPLKKLHYVEERDYYVIAALHLGRCPPVEEMRDVSKRQWLPGDFSTMDAQRLIFNDFGENKLLLKVNLPMYKYCLEWDCKKNPVTPPDYCFDNTKKVVIANMGHHKPADEPCKQCVCYNGTLECTKIGCQLPTRSCSIRKKGQDECCPCDPETAVKKIQLNIKLKLDAFKTDNAPLGSCLIFKVKNTFNRIIYAKVIYVGGQKPKSKYQLNFDRETRSSKTAYGLLVHLHRGWCPSISNLYQFKSTLVNKDYENKKEWPAKTRVEPGKSKYEAEVKMIQKCIGSTCATDALDYCIDKQGKRREKFSSWKVDECINCFCNKRAQLECAKQQCQTKCHASVAIKKPGQCCPECPEQHPCYDHLTNKTYNEGESWKRDDGCIRCTCFGGMAHCMTSACRLPECGPTNFLVNVDGLCCPICNNRNVCETNGMKREEGTYWQNEDCTVCQCTSEGTKCFKVEDDTGLCNGGVKMSAGCPRFCLP